jgi:REP element-mobilizing transposase RayT
MTGLEYLTRRHQVENDHVHLLVDLPPRMTVAPTRWVAGHVPRSQS